jgi:hypothetical protein
MRRHFNISKRQIIKRKNFLPTLIVTILLWGILGGLIYFITPDTMGALPLFFILSFLALLFTFSLLFADSGRGFIVSLGLIVFLILRYLGIGNIINLLLIAGLVVTAEFYFTRR